MVVEALAGRLPSGARAEALLAVPVDLCERWSAADRVVVVDAVVSGAEPGTVRRVDALGEPLPTEAGPASTHGLGLKFALDLARTLDRLPGGLVIYGVEAATLEAGAGLSPAVAAAVGGVADAVARELSGQEG